MLIAGIIVIIIIIAGAFFIGLPLINGKTATGPAHQQASSLPTQSATLFPATPAAGITAAPAVGITPAAQQTYEEKYTQTYTQVYAVNQAFLGGQKIIYTQNLAAPPLYIKFNIIPKMFYEERPVEIGLSSEHIANISYPSQDAWFKVQVYDADNGELKEEQGFNKGYGITTQQEFMVRAPGNYRVEMSGNDVIADVRILTGKS